MVVHFQFSHCDVSRISPNINLGPTQSLTTRYAAEQDLHYRVVQGVRCFNSNFICPWHYKAQMCKQFIGTQLAVSAPAEESTISKGWVQAAKTECLSSNHMNASRGIHNSSLSGAEVQSTSKCYIPRPTQAHIKTRILPFHNIYIDWR